MIAVKQEAKKSKKQKEKTGKRTGPQQICVYTEITSCSELC